MRFSRSAHSPIAGWWPGGRPEYQRRHLPFGGMCPGGTLTCGEAADVVVAAAGAAAGAGAGVDATATATVVRAAPGAALGTAAGAAAGVAVDAVFGATAGVGPSTSTAPAGIRFLRSAHSPTGGW
jgi:hypothetical protein